MADSNAVGGLQWVKDEIVTSLQRVLGWLEEFVEREGGQSQLNDAVTALSEVRGLLSGLQLIGPARLTEEMQILCEDLQAESLLNRGEVAEALMLALIQLSDYLGKLGADQADIPMALLPSINDLRGSRGAAPLSEAELLVPASVLAESEMLAADVRRSLGKIAVKVRPHFHRYLLQWLGDDTSRQGLVGLDRLFHRLQRYIGAGVFHELFLVAEAVAEGLLDGSIAADTRTKAMVAHLDRVIKSLGADPDAWPEANAQSQLFDLLSLIANCESSSYRVKELRSAYGLEQAAEGGEPVPALAAMPASSRTIGEMPPAGEESDVGAAELPTPITSAKHTDPELRDPDRRTAKVIPWPVPGRARTEGMAPALDSGEAETEAADEEIAEIATLAEADDALLDIFRSEAREHLAVLRAYCVRGQENVGPAVPDESVLRALHTLTGSARTTGVLSTARVTAPLERLFQDHRARDAAPNTALLKVLGRGADALEMRLTHIPGCGDEMETLRDLAVDLEERIARLEPEGGADHIPSAEGPGELSEEAFVSRLSQQGGRMGSRLGELDRTLDRLGNQLRDLEIEIEAQIIHRYESDADTLAPGEAGFDPLELDGFSTLQLLSRSLAETVDDLGSLRTQLQDLQGESDTLLQHQAQLAEDLQGGLLRTRMVPFVQAVPRLHLVVRQAAQQLRKEARLKVSGPEVELERSIQQRMLAPLEHLLRNAVAHGIELPEQREREGKPATGVVSLMLNREGGDLVITVADDGAGLDLDAIRRHAMDSGLVVESTEAGEEALTGLILEAGFSTADEVSQIAGRGVGLDVVNAEVKQLSGSLGLETLPGRGTSFTIRLPLTLMDNA